MDIVHCLGNMKKFSSPHTIIIRFTMQFYRDIIWREAKNSGFLRDNNLCVKEALTPEDAARPEMRERERHSEAPSSTLKAKRSTAWRRNRKRKLSAWFVTEMVEYLALYCCMTYYLCHGLGFHHIILNIFRDFYLGFYFIYLVSE